MATLRNITKFNKINRCRMEFSWIRRFDFWSVDLRWNVGKSLNLSISLLPLGIIADKRLVPFAIGMLLRNSDTCHRCFNLISEFLSFIEDWLLWWYKKKWCHHITVRETYFKDCLKFLESELLLKAFISLREEKELK